MIGAAVDLRPVVRWSILLLCACLLQTHVVAQQPDGDDDDDGGGWNLSVGLPPAWAQAFEGWGAFPPQASFGLARRMMVPGDPWAISGDAWAVTGSESSHPDLTRAGDPCALPLSGLPAGVAAALRSVMTAQEAQENRRYPCVQTHGGYLVSVDLSTTGSMVWVDEADGALTTVSRLPCRTFARFRGKGKLVAIGGWMGLTSFAGELQVLSENTEGRPPAVERTVVLPQPGLAACSTAEGTLLVVCETLIVEVGLDYTVIPLYGYAGLDAGVDGPRQVATWTFLGGQPTVRCIGKDIAVGTRSGIVYLKRIDVPGRPVFQESWVLPKGLLDAVPPTRLYFGNGP